MPTDNTDLKGIADLLEVDLDHIVSSSNVEYCSDQRWGFVNTPAERNAKSIGETVSERFPYTSLSAVYNILVHVLDNVANYGMIEGKAKGTVVVALNDASLEVYVCNHTNRILPPTLKDRTYTVSDGIIKVPASERDVETGGGNGVYYVTKFLPYVYSRLVETSKTASVSWRQNKDQAIFKLSIPIPSESELTRCNDYIARRDEEVRSFELAKPYIIKTKNRDGSKRECKVTTPAGEVIPILRQALRSAVNFPENRRERFFEVVDVLETIQLYGRDASNAGLEVRNIVLCGAAAIHGIDVLMKIEERKGEYCNHFASSLKEDYPEENNMDMVVAAVAKYFEASYAHVPPEESSSLKDKLIEAFVKGQRRFDVAKVFIDIDPSLMPQSRVGEVVDEVLSKGKCTWVEENTVNVICNMLEAQGHLSDEVRGKLEQILEFKDVDRVSYRIKGILE